MEKYLSSKWCWNLNSQPSEHESPPITTRPGRAPAHATKYVDYKFERGNSPTNVKMEYGVNYRKNTIKVQSNASAIGDKVLKV